MCCVQWSSSAKIPITRYVPARLLSRNDMAFCFSERIPTQTHTIASEIRPQPNQGHGLSFSVPHGVTVPPSLRNIYKELLSDANVPEFDSLPRHGNLERWAGQGVLLLNNVLTVRRGEAASHSKRGWEEFTDRVIEAVVRQEGDDDECDGGTTTGDDRRAGGEDDERDEGRLGTGVVFLLWGKPASLKATTVLARSGKGERARHAVITCSHPR
jgi:uracil-DNA glycosylase